MATSPLAQQQEYHFSTLRPKKRSSFVSLPDKASFPSGFQPSFLTTQLARNARPSPLFPNLSVYELQRAWEKTLDYHYGKRFSLLSNPTDRVYRFKQHFFSRPYYIIVQFMQLNEQETTMALYVHSQFRMRNHSSKVGEFGSRLVRQFREEIKDSFTTTNASNNLIVPVQTIDTNHHEAGSTFDDLTTRTDA